MGLLKTILEREPTAAPVTPTVADGLPTVDRPAACPACRGVVFWLDVYSGLHCAACDPLPDSGRLVRGMLEFADGAWLKLGQADSTGAGPADPDELVEFEILAATGRVLRFMAIDDRRCPPGRVAKPACDHNGDEVPGTLGRYNPSLACGPVGDLTLDEWFDRLPEWSFPSGNRQ